MTFSLKTGVATMVLAALPLAATTTVGLFALAEPALAQGKSGSAGGGKPEGKGAGKPDRASSGGVSAGRPASASASQGRATESSQPESRETGLSRSDLRGLNSLRRNINGLMGSSDPKMESFRAFVEATSALEEAEKGLAQVQGGYETALAAYESLGLSGDAAADLASLTGTLASLQAPDPETATQEELDAHAAQVAALTDAIDVVTAYLGEAEIYAIAKQAHDAAAAQTSEQAMIDAFVVAMQSSGQADFIADDITPEMMAEITRQMERLAGAYNG